MPKRPREYKQWMKDPNPKEPKQTKHSRKKRQRKIAEQLLIIAGEIIETRRAFNDNEEEDAGGYIARLSNCYHGAVKNGTLQYPTPKKTMVVEDVARGTRQNHDERATQRLGEEQEEELQAEEEEKNYEGGDEEDHAQDRWGMGDRVQTGGGREEESEKTWSGEESTGETDDFESAPQEPREERTEEEEEETRQAEDIDAAAAAERRRNNNQVGDPGENRMFIKSL
ncbi:RNA polymerase II-associated factor 1 homolog [Linepithema humile]|uniref:RNA polymerase II-associated factor 1 homolog n=1 Tax=Linepithema humile TaxID=83485 RepID=UPI00351EF625